MEKVYYRMPQIDAAFHPATFALGFVIDSDAGIIAFYLTFWTVAICFD
jgi:hypothetical protein